MTEDHIDFLAEIVDMATDDAGRWDFAAETLNGIYETVKRTQRVMEGQQRAVKNIRDGGLRGSQKYERL